jgi:phosphate/sulfate permease
MGNALTSGGLAPWGQAAAFILALYLFLSLIAGLVLAMALFFLMAWLREKSEQIKKLRPLMNKVNQALVASQRGETPSAEITGSRLASVAARVPQITGTLPAQASKIEQQVEGGSDRMAGMVIEFHARVQQGTGFIKAFFLPGLTKHHHALAPVVQNEQEKHLMQGEHAQEGHAARREPPLEQDIVITQPSR